MIDIENKPTRIELKKLEKKYLTTIIGYDSTKENLRFMKIKFNTNSFLDHINLQGDKREKVKDYLLGQAYSSNRIILFWFT